MIEFPEIFLKYVHKDDLDLLVKIFGHLKIATAQPLTFFDPNSRSSIFRPYVNTLRIQLSHIGTNIIPEEIGNLKTPISLFLYAKKFNIEVLQSFDNLKELHIDLELYDHMVDLSHLSNLESMFISGFEGELPEWFVHSKISNVVNSWAKRTDFPSILKRMPNLEYLDFRGNRLDINKVKIKDMDFPNLKMLKIGQNESFTQLPLKLLKIKSLKYLDLEGTACYGWFHPSKVNESHELDEIIEVYGLPEIMFGEYPDPKYEIFVSTLPEGKYKGVLLTREQLESVIINSRPI